MPPTLPTRDRLINSARYLFWERGFAGTSMADLLAHADVNSGSFYHFFESKEALLREVLEEDDRVVLSDYIEARGVDYYNAVIARGLEGIIAKHKQTRYYTGKRSKDWIKIKKKATLDCVICGITAGEGEREDTFGSLILGAYHEGTLVHVGRVGTGFSEAGRRQIIERLRPLKGPCPFPEEPEIDAHVGFWTKPVLVCEAHFLEWSKDRRMRAPSFSRMRDDKRPDDCVVTFP